MIDGVRLEVTRDADTVAARQRGRELAAECGFSLGDQTVIAAAISEVTRNILLYAGRGEVTIDVLKRGDQMGLVVVARDDGPGIANLDQALVDGFSTSGGLGLGLPGTKRLMDEFTIDTTVGRGTTVTMCKWTNSA